MRKCKYCKELTRNKKYCSYDCMRKYFKKYRISSFYNPELHREVCRRGGKIGGKRAAETNRLLCTSCFFNKDLQSLGGRSAWKGKRRLVDKQLQEFRVGIYNNDTRKIACDRGGKTRATQLKETQTGFYSSKIQRMGLLASVKSVIVENMIFSSVSEAQIGLCIHYQFKKLEFGKNWEIPVGNKRIDFLINDTFIESHSMKKNRTDINGNTIKKYFTSRRKVLDDNGYKNYNLIVIT